MGVIYDVSRFILHLLRGHYAELNEPASSLCPTQCLSNMPIGPIDWVKIYRSHDCLPKPHCDKSSRVSLVVDKHCRCRIYWQREANYKNNPKNNFVSVGQISLMTPLELVWYQSKLKSHWEVQTITKAYTRTRNGASGANMCTHRTTGDMHAHAHSLMRDFLTFLHVPLENIDESPFKNNSCLVGSLNDLQLFHQHIIITFIMWDCADQGCCCTRGRPFSVQQTPFKVYVAPTCYSHFSLWCSDVAYTGKHYETGNLTAAWSLCSHSEELCLILHSVLPPQISAPRCQPFLIAGFAMIFKAFVTPSKPPRGQPFSRQDVRMNLVLSQMILIICVKSDGVHRCELCNGKSNLRVTEWP